MNKSRHAPSGLFGAKGVALVIAFAGSAAPAFGQDYPPAASAPAPQDPPAQPLPAAEPPPPAVIPPHVAPPAPLPAPLPAPALAPPAPAIAASPATAPPNRLPINKGGSIQVMIAAAGASGISGFHMIPQSNCQRRWETPETGCIRWVVRTGDFGPKTINHRYWLEYERDYYLIPVCGTELDWRNSQQARGSTDIQRVELVCQSR